MLPSEIAERILEGHITKKPTIDDIPGFILKLKLDYSGRMATHAYEKKWKRKRNQGRRKVGCFDFEILRRIDGSRVTHVHLMKAVKAAGKGISKAMIEEVFMGKDPWDLGLDDDVAIILQEAQLEMLEQEINWGDEQFQHWSKFPPSEKKRPRDYIMAYLRRIKKEPDLLEKIPKKQAASGTWGTLPVPDNKKEWGDFLEPKGSAAGPWISGVLLARFQEGAKSMPDNPYYKQ